MQRTSLIGHRIRTIRRSNGHTQVALAKAAGISAAYLNLIEHNRRAIGGKTLLRLAEELNVAPSELTGSEENRILTDLDELSCDPLFESTTLERNDLTTILGIAPNVANAMITLYRAYKSAVERIDLLSERLSHDPFLSHAAHNVVSHITSIRSFAEILQDHDDLSNQQRDKFIQSLTKESHRLSNAATEIFSFLDSRDVNRQDIDPADEVDDLIYDYNNYFPSIEARAKHIYPNIARNDSIFLADLIRYLEHKYNIIVKRVKHEKLDFKRSKWDHKDNVILLSKSLPHSSNRFELARIVAKIEAKDEIEHIIKSTRLTTDISRERAREALYSYCASALIFPYEQFLQIVETERYDIEIIKQQYAASWEQVCHRLTTLHRLDNKTIPFHLIRTDIAGNVSKRFSASGLQLPRYDGACPRWALHHALLSPEDVKTQIVTTPDNATYIFIAKSISKGHGGYNQQRTIHSIMIGCDAAYAKRIIYTDNINMNHPETAIPVGITCRTCPKDNCNQRAYKKSNPNVM